MPPPVTAQLQPAPSLNNKPPSFNAEVLARVPAKWAIRFQIFPLEYAHNVLKIAIAEPLDVLILQDIEFYLQTTVNPVLTQAKDIDEMIRTHYGVGAEIIH